MFYVRSLRINTVPTPYAARSRQLKLSFNKSGQNSLSAQKSAAKRQKPHAKTARTRHGHHRIRLLLRSHSKPQRRGWPVCRAHSVLAPVLRKSAQSLPAGTALYAWARSRLARQAPGKLPAAFDLIPADILGQVRRGVLAYPPIARDHGAALATMLLSLPSP